MTEELEIEGYNSLLPNSNFERTAKLNCGKEYRELIQLFRYKVPRAQEIADLIQQTAYNLFGKGKGETENCLEEVMKNLNIVEAVGIANRRKQAMEDVIANIPILPETEEWGYIEVLAGKMWDKEFIKLKERLRGKDNAFQDVILFNVLSQIPIRTRMVIRLEDGRFPDILELKYLTDTKRQVTRCNVFSFEGSYKYGETANLLELLYNALTPENIEKIEDFSEGYKYGRAVTTIRSMIDSKKMKEETDKSVLNFRAMKPGDYKDSSSKN